MSNEYLVKNVRVINWHGYDDKTFIFDQISLVCGKNANGKSAFLDAFAYGLLGDTNFNSAADNGKKSEKRTLKSYNLKLVASDPEEYERKNGTCSYILIEIWKQKRIFTLGTVIWITANDTTNVRRFIADGKGVRDFDIFEMNGKKRRTYPAEEFSEKNNIVFKSGDTAITEFCRALGLPLGDRKKMREYRRRMSSAKFYDANKDVQKLILEDVLRPSTVEITKLEEANEVFRNERATYEAICTEMEELEQILAAYEAYENLKRQIDINRAKVICRKTEDSKTRLTALIDKEANLKNEQKDTENDASAVENKIDSLEDSIHTMERNIMDGNAPLKDAEKRREVIMEDIERIESLRDSLASFQVLIDKTISAYPEIQNRAILERLSDPSISSKEKTSAVNVLERFLKEKEDELGRRDYQLMDSMERLSEEITSLRKTEETLVSNRNSLEMAGDSLKLRDDINRELVRRGNPERAALACEYVQSVDKDWQDVIEAYLGWRRFDVIAPAKVHYIAYEVWLKGRDKYYRHATLINTEKLLKRDKAKITESSLYEKLAISNPDAIRFFSEELGYIAAVEHDEDIRNYEYAISRNGAMEMGIREKSLDFSRIRFYTFGQEAIKRNLEETRGKLRGLTKKAEELGKEKADLRRVILIVKNALSKFGVYDYDVERHLLEANTELKGVDDEIKEIEKAIENDSVTQSLMHSLSEKKELCRQERSELSRLNARKQDIINDLALVKVKIEEETKESERCFAEFEDFKKEFPLIADEAASEYSKDKKVWSEGYAKQQDQALVRLKDNENGIIDTQTRYSIAHPEISMPRGVEGREIYQGRYNEIKVGRKEEAKAVMEEALEEYEQIIKKSVVLAIYDDYQDCLEDRRALNERLGKTNFKDGYRLTIELNDDDKGRAILNYGKILAEKEIGETPGQLSFFGQSADPSEEERLWGEIRKIFSEALDRKNPRDLQKLCDYRNYITPDLEVTGKASGKKARLSKQTRYNSGGEGRIPRFLLVLSALQVIYDDAGECLRLVMIDEPFEKIDADNVAELMRYIKDQGLQIVICSSDFHAIEPFCQTQNLVSIDYETKDIDVIPVRRNI